VTGVGASARARRARGFGVGFAAAFLGLGARATRGLLDAEALAEDPAEGVPAAALRVRGGAAAAPAEALARRAATRRALER
jgi:hypothetical protein